MTVHSNENAIKSRSGDCKGCDRNPILSDKKIEQLVALAIQGKEPHELAPVSVQEERLAACMSCPSLQFGTTCKHCGCMVQIRTLLLNNYCPSPYGSQWIAVSV